MYDEYSAAKAFAQAIESHDPDRASVAWKAIVGAIADTTNVDNCGSCEPFVRADVLFETGEWDGVERIYRAVLASPDTDAVGACRANGYLARLLSLLHRYAESLQHLTQAIHSANTLALPSSFVVGLTLEECDAFLGLRRPAEASGALHALASLLDEGGCGGNFGASLLVTQARCHTATNEINAARHSLHEAQRLLAHLGEFGVTPGLQYDLIEYWRAVGRLRIQTSDREGAVEAWKEAAKRCRQLVSLPHPGHITSVVTLAEVLNELAEVYSSAGKDCLARKVTGESRIAWRTVLPGKEPLS